MNPPKPGTSEYLQQRVAKTWQEMGRTEFWASGKAVLALQELQLVFSNTINPTTEDVELVHAIVSEYQYRKAVMVLHRIRSS